MRPLNSFKNSVKIHRAHLYHLEPVVKFAGHLEIISCGDFSQFVFFNFGALFKYMPFLMHLNLAKFILVALGLPGQLCQVALLIVHH